MMILDYLDLNDRKGMRLVSKDMDRVARKQVFRRVCFDLDPGGCAALTSISRHSKLRLEVREVALRRRIFLPIFHHFDAFVRAIADESRARWGKLGESGQHAVFANYQLHAIQLDRFAAGLAATVWRSALTRFPSEPPTDVERTLNGFATAITSCPRLMSLSHRPSFDSHFDRWVWQGWSFGPLIRLKRWSDADAEALQVLAVLHVLARHKPDLHRISIVSDGPAFLSESHISELLTKWAYKGATRPADGALHTFIHSECPTDVSENRRIEARKALKTLTPVVSFSSDLRLDVRHTDLSRQLMASLPAIFGLIQQASRPQTLQLRIGIGLTTEEYLPAFELRGSLLSTSRIKLEEQWLFNVLQKASHLDHLDIQNTSLTQGTWKTVLCYIRRNLRLRSIKLYNLGYTPEDSSKGPLFVPVQFIQGSHLCASYLQGLVTQESESKFG